MDSSSRAQRKGGGESRSLSVYCLFDRAWWAGGCKKCGEEFNYVCTSTEPESADSRAQRRHRRLKDDRRPTTWRVTGPQSSAIDQPLEFPINLPSDTFPVGSSIGGRAGVTAERWPIRQEGSGNLRTGVYPRLIGFHQTLLAQSQRQGTAPTIQSIKSIWWECSWLIRLSQARLLIASVSGRQKLVWQRPE